MVTSFTRIIIVLSFVRTAIGTQQSPPNQVLSGLALLLTFFVMAPVIKDVNANAVQPYLKGSISQQVALERGAAPLRKFMFRQTREKDLQLFYSISKEPRPAEQKDVPTYHSHSGVRHLGAEDGLRDRLRALRTVHRHRHGDGAASCSRWA